MSQSPDRSEPDNARAGTGSRARDRGAVRLPGADDGSAELAAGLAEIGLSPKAAWYSSAFLYGSGGLVVTLLYVIDPTLFARGVFYLGCSAIVIGILCLLAARYLIHAERIMVWTTHARLIIGLGIFLAAVFIMHDKVVAFALVPLFIVPTPCYLYTWRLAVPYVLAGSLLVLIAQLPIAGPAHLAHALVTTFAFMVIATSIIVTRQRTRVLAFRNLQLAYTDPLTGIANVRSMRARISNELRPSGDRLPFALFAMDLDNFKQVNDRFDHSLGDTVLCAVSDAISEQLEPGDLAVRRGGDEFALLVASPGERDLDELRERVERAIARARIATCPQVTPSGTVAYILTRAGEEIGTMMERADQALHDAKVISRERRRVQASALAGPLEGAGEQGARPSARAVERPEPAGEGSRGGHARGVLAAAVRAIGQSHPVWRFAALLFALWGIVIALVSVAQMVEPLTPIAGAAIGAGFLALALACLWAGIAESVQAWLHIPWFAGYGLLALAILLAGHSGTALLDLIPATVLYGFLMFKARTAALYLILGQGLYGAFAIGAGFADGTTRTVITTAVIAVVGGLVARLRLVTVHFARANRELSELDALTGVANVRALRARIVDVTERASSQQHQPVVVAIDLDEFKSVNDLHSHSTGDRVLIAVARAVSERVRIDELVARRGGDEFFVVLNDADPQYTDAVVERIRDAIARARTRVCPDLRPTASVASVPWHPGETPGDFLHEADVALHAEKAESRLITYAAPIAKRSAVAARTPASRISARSARAVH